jgi:DNA-binding response OmpR family regulator
LAHIIVVEDERELADLVACALRSEGHSVEVIGDGTVALRRLTAPGGRPPDLVVLDLRLPGVDGLEITRRLRRESITPILMLTARSTELDKVLGLELGADDYLTKPVAIRELQARVSAILRRVEMMRDHSRTEGDDLRSVVHEGLIVDPVSRDVLVAERSVTLTAREFDLLYLLAANPGRVFSREYLLDRIWGEGYGGYDRTVDTHILRVRRKLGGPGTPADRIVTLWGVGYKFERTVESGR